jgi:hypothetical protein
MRPMKHSHLVEEVDRYTTTFSLGYLGAKPDEEGLYVLPSDVRAGRMGKESFECLAVAALHGAIVPRAGTVLGSEA